MDFWDLRQDKELDRLDEKSNQATSEISRLQKRIFRLEHQLSEHTLGNQALWALLQSRFDLNEEDILSLVNQLRVDQARATGRIHCPKCHQKTAIKYKSACIAAKHCPI